MSEKETKKPEVTQEVKSEGGDMKIKSKPKKFTAKDQPVKVDLRKYNGLFIFFILKLILNNEKLLSYFRSYT